MTDTLKLLLSAHVVLGLLGVAAYYYVWIGLVKQKLNFKMLQRASLKGFMFLVLSWVTGGYYYAIYYGKAVRSVIKAGAYPWAHAVFMEAKEHVFLFLPFLALTLTILLYRFGDKLESNPTLKKELIFLSAVTTIIGIIITLSGALISGAVR